MSGSVGITVTPAAASSGAPAVAQGSAQGTAQGTAQGGGQTAAQTLPGTVQNPPPAIANAGAGAIIQGVVAGKGEMPNTLVVNTPQGTVVVQTSAQLPAGTPVVLQVQGQAPASTNVVVAFAQAIQAGTQAATQGAAAPQGLLGQLLGALRGNAAAGQAAGAQAPSGPVTIAPSATLTATVTGAASAAGGGVTAGGTAGGLQGLISSLTGASSGAAGGAPGAAAPGAVPGASASAGLPVGTQWTVRLAGVQLPGGAPLPTTAGATGAALLLGTVTGMTASGEPVVATPSGQLTLGVGAQLPAGAKVAIELVGQRLAAQPAASLSENARALLSLARMVPELDEALQALMRADPELAQQLSSSLMPKPTSQLGATALFFLTALRGGELKGWLGGGLKDIERALDRIGRRDLIDKLGERFGDVGRSARETPSGQWRAYPLPMQQPDGQVQAVQIYVRDNNGRDEDGEETAGGGTRFVVEFSLSKLGPLQLDGLVKERRFDLILRGAQPLDAEDKAHVTQLFQDALEITGFKGGLHFQVAREFPVQPLKEMNRHLTGLVA
ncbi:MAG: hypothetical protein JNK11_16355 [Alphaproteobacteria bacterium]|nr:hypothetical protein [Alphaproteobacteria bacterium]